MSGLVETLRENRKNPSVLKARLIKVRGAKPTELIFVFEGHEDIGVYEAWITRTTKRPTYEPIAGDGKEQLVGLLKALVSNDDPLQWRIFFFVDCDFDRDRYTDARLFTLDAYSIENLLCTSAALESILADELRCSGNPLERQRIAEEFERVFSEFRAISSEINFALFVARRLGIKVTRRPEKVHQFADVGLTTVTKTYETLSDIVQLEAKPDENDLRQLAVEFSLLSCVRAQRGKYVMQAFRKWIRVLAEDRKCSSPTLFTTSLPNFSADLHGVSLRRLASSSPLPCGLDAFIGRATGET